MQSLLRPQTYPYASSSTGPYRGLLVRKYPCWDAQGSVRDTFTNEIAGKIKECLEQCLPESNSFVGFSLFMVGKVPEKTKPTIMIVSDDKVRRKAAFQMVKTKKILSKYPGFELGHCSVAAEFKDLKPLGTDTSPSASILESTEDDGGLQYIGDEYGAGPEVLSLLSAEVCAFEYPNGIKPTRLYFHTSPHLHSHCLASATCGGLFRFEGDIYALTMAHAIKPNHCANTSPQQWEAQTDSSSDSDDFEITGMDDWDDEEDGSDNRTLTAITSPGSKTPSELSDSEESLLSLLKRHDSQRSSDMSTRTRITSAPSVILEDDAAVDACECNELECEDELPLDCVRIGTVVAVDLEMDIAVVKVDAETYGKADPLTHSISDALNRDFIHDFFNDDLTNTSTTVETMHQWEIKGQRSQVPFFGRLPGTSNFLELHSVRLSTSLRPGDSGSWAYDGQGAWAGFVVAGNPNSVSCLLLPARPALQSMLSLLRRRVLAEAPLHSDMSERQLARNLQRNFDSSRSPSPDSKPVPGKGDIGKALYDFLAPLRHKADDDTKTVASSLPPPSVFSQRMDRGTPSTTTYSVATSYENRHPVQESPFQYGASTDPTSVSKSDFMQGQVAQLRRELERAWEIIQEKDKRLYQYITDHTKNDTSAARNDLFLVHQDDLASTSQLSSQDPAQTQQQSSPSGESPPQLTFVPEKPHAETPQTPVDIEAARLKKFKALQTELETNHAVMKELRTSWQRQVDANEALHRENRELKGAMSRAIAAIEHMQIDGGDSGGLPILGSDLRHALFKYTPSGSAATTIKGKTEPGKTSLKDTLSSEELSRRMKERITRDSRRARRMERLENPTTSSTRPSVTFPASRKGIESVPELDEPDSEADDAPVYQEGSSEKAIIERMPWRGPVKSKFGKWAFS
ncbi:hypothetical protein F5B22DRAFT_417922 [Xylaria bambusicola]|uniref:uncharacterized protein n=1 Tax=Xylaria bambusicola TaxID=326684 RepID=UPI00200890EE|nr:uncharacterized protein F5B22DRAFT_417922 [Xylaria bambusicola]KAI0523807.1 hypothetical protein F5B22DRAFT_417922 [Xylaria bambusicola]